jgi:uncharacterized repeat protein (TIGR01451 family)
MTARRICTFLAAAALALCARAGSARAGELVKNGGFETGSFSGGWVDGAGQLSSGQTNPAWADHLVALDLPFSGDYSALIGFKYAQIRGNRFGFIYQDVAIPANVSRADLFFKFRQQGWDGNFYDPFRMQIRNTSNAVLATVIDYSFAEANHLFKDSGWLDDNNAVPVGYSMTSYAGQTVRLYFYQENSFNNFYETWTYIDDVSLVFRRWVDLAVDGDGNDLFGGIGTGAGGASIKSGEAGDTISYAIDIENEGPVGDAYRLTANPPAGWTAALRYNGATYAFPWDTPAIPAGSTIQAEIVLIVPFGAPVSGYSTVVDAVSRSFANRYDSVLLGTNVVPADFLADLAIDANGYGVIDPAGGGGISYREAVPGAQANYALEVFNAGVQADSFRIHWTAASPLTAAVLDGALVRTRAFSTGLIASGSSASYTLRVTVPVSLTGGDYTNFVYARSLTDTLKKDAVRAVTRVLAPKVDMIIGGSGDDIIDATGAGLGGAITVAARAGTTISFPFVLQNEGAVADSFTLSWTSPGAGWTARVNDGAADHALPWRTPTLAPFSERNYTLVVTVPAGASYDTYRSILNAVSSVSALVRESVTASISVSSGNEIDLVIDGNGDNVYGYLGTALGGTSVKTAMPGDTVTFAITVENESGENLFDIWWNGPPGWDVRIGDSTATMRRVTAGTYTLTVRVPAGCSGGTFDVVVDGVKTNKRYFVDSVRGRIVVTAQRVVDALIDGNGDELFGETGTGAGGSSMQTTTAGRTVRFTVELQNQGSEPESYRVSWNAIPDYIATLQNAASPYTTAPVAPGGAALLSFAVRVPYTAAAGDLDYVLDVVSTIDPGNVESVRARVLVNPPPRADLVINGDGAFDSAPPGSGDGGRALVFGSPGTEVTAVLELWNRGGYPDSFRVSWSPPAGWPAGSIVLSDGSGDHASPYLVGVIDPGEFLVFTVRVSIPAGAALRTPIIIDGIALSRDLEDSVTLEVAISSFVAGVVFNDKDHDGSLDAGEEGWIGVTVTLSDPGGPLVRQTDGSSAYLFEVPAGVARDVAETTPVGMISLSPDVVSLPAAAPGETLRVDFADVRVSTIAPSNNLSGPAGTFVDSPHVIVAGTSGQATLSVSLPAGWVEAFYRDNDGDGAVGPADSLLRAADLALDPDSAGRATVPIIARIFIPPQAVAGTTAPITIILSQVLSGTSIQTESSVIDRILVLASATGMLRLLKEVDLAEAHPGDTMTYTITFSNPGIEGVREIEIVDPLSASVELVRDAFGAGMDIEWVKNGVPEYLTADPGDADEAMLETADGTLRVILSRRAPFTLESGATGRITYRVRIR